MTVTLAWLCSRDGDLARRVVALLVDGDAAATAALSSSSCVGVRTHVPLSTSDGGWVYPDLSFDCHEGEPRRGGALQVLVEVKWDSDFHDISGQKQPDAYVTLWNTLPESIEAPVKRVATLTRSGAPPQQSQPSAGEHCARRGVDVRWESIFDLFDAGCDSTIHAVAHDLANAARDEDDPEPRTVERAVTLFHDLLEGVAREYPEFGIPGTTDDYPFAQTFDGKGRGVWIAVTVPGSGEHEFDKPESLIVGLIPDRAWAPHAVETTKLGFYPAATRRGRSVRVSHPNPGGSTREELEEFVRGTLKKLAESPIAWTPAAVP